jgi:hypothetical protein
MPRETPARNGLAINLGRMNAGAHTHNIVDTAAKTPRRGTTGVGTSAPAASSPSGARYSLKPKSPKAKKLA